MVVYKITNKNNGQCYIGLTKQKLHRRWNAHCNSGRSLVGKAIQTHGQEAFTISIISEHSSLEDLNNAEEYFISFHNSIYPNGYNLHSGGNSHQVSDLTRRKLSESHKGKIHAGSFRPGYRPSAEVLKKLSESHMGKKDSEETRLLKSLRAKGRPKSKEHNAKVSAANKGRKPSLEHRRKMSAARKNLVWYKHASLGRRIFYSLLRRP